MNNTEELKQLLRETAMRNQICMPENEQDEIWFEQGLNTKESGDFMERLFNALELGRYQPSGIEATRNDSVISGNGIIVKTKTAVDSNWCFTCNRQKVYCKCYPVLQANEVKRCPACEGDGCTVEAECCMRPDVEVCCGQPVPVQVKCEKCNGTGEEQKSNLLIPKQ